VSDANKLLQQEFARLVPSGLVELFILDATELGGDILYFYDGTGAAIRPDVPNPPISFQGRSYTPLPIQIKGFEMRSKGELPRPTMQFSNIFGAFTALVLAFDDLVGAKIIRKRTLRKFLDDGTEPNPDAEMPEDVYFIDRKSMEDKQLVEFELTTPLDLEGVILPRRQVISNICGWRYRSPECSFSENRFVAAVSDRPYPDRLPMAKYAGVFSLTKTYTQGQCVSSVQANGDIWYYFFTDVSGNAPLTDTTKWNLVQRYRGEWKAQTEDGVDLLYVTDDVVYITGRGGRQLFIFTATSALGAASEPPNLNLWVPDTCGKLLTSCKLRFDSLSLNLPLPYGAFPGTSRVPDV
jgi:lambda family phage minor tail protein L